MALQPQRSIALKIEIKQEPQRYCVACAGRLVAGNTGQLKEAVKPLLSAAPCVVLDLTNLATMDSAGLGTIVGLLVSARSSGCALQLVNLSKQVRELLGITHLLDAFKSCGEHMIKMP